jgi:hypothetical protein
MKYARPPWPIGIYDKFSETAKALGYEKRGSRWKMLTLLLDYASLHPDFFRNRE